MIHFFRKSKYPNFLFLFSTFSAVLISGTAWGQQSIEGFRDIPFGTSLAQAQSSFVLSEQEPNGAMGMDSYFGASEQIEVAGETYDLGLGFREEVLVNVTLSRWLPESVSADILCESEFDRVFGLVQSTYGEPDQPPSVNRAAFTRAESARFTDQTGAYILLAAMAVGQNCLINVSYNDSPEGGSGF